MVANEQPPILQLNPDDLLARRGLTQTAQAAGWNKYELHGSPGWVYPLFRSDGKAVADVKRWKNADSNGDLKYCWFGKGEKPKYYLFGDTKRAIADKGGVCYLASGEPDVLAYRAAGIRNVICWFGENSIPDSLADDLKYLGVTVLNDYPDRDTAGITKAARVMELLKGSPILYLVYKLPGDDDSKNDINWLWIEKEFNATRFESALLDCDAYSEGELALSIPAVEKPPKQPEIAKQAEWTDKQQEAIDKIAHARLADDVRVYMERHYDGWQSDGWSKNKKCPFHDDQHASAGVNRDSLVYTCFVPGCVGTLDKVQYGERIGLSLQSYVEKVEGEFRSNPLPSSKPANVVSLPIASSEPTYVDSDAALIQVRDVLTGDALPTYIPRPFPYSVLHRFGGFAEIMIPGKLTYIMGVSGGGKTSFLEQIIEDALRAGEDCILYSPEWSAAESRKRSIQRAGGMTVTEMGKFELYRIDAKRGIPPGQRAGTAPSKERLSQTLAIIESMAAWKGKSAQFKQDLHFANMTQLTDEIEKIVEDKRAAGRNVTTLAFDYIQRAPKGGYGDWDRLEMAASAIKGVCERHSLFGYVLIQPRKNDSKAARDGLALTESGAQGISDQQANLFIAITPKFEGNKKLPYVELGVVNNNLGETGEVHLKTAWQLLTICDVEQRFETASLKDKAAVNYDTTADD